jgi:hypothetical protein
VHVDIQDQISAMQKYLSQIQSLETHSLQTLEIELQRKTRDCELEYEKEKQNL